MTFHYYFIVFIYLLLCTFIMLHFCERLFSFYIANYRYAMCWNFIDFEKYLHLICLTFKKRFLLVKFLVGRQWNLLLRIDGQQIQQQVDGFIKFLLNGKAKHMAKGQSMNSNMDKRLQWSLKECDHWRKAVPYSESYLRLVEWFLAGFSYL